METQRATTISEIYIDDENQTNWSKKHLTAHDFKTEPFPIRALSETNRYELKRFYEYIPEEILNSKKHEQEFLEEKRLDYPHLQMEDLQIEWITFLCHEELTSQGDTDDHMWFSHGIEINDIKDEIRIQKNKKPKLSLKEANNLKELSEKSINLLMETWYESALANDILSSDIGRFKDKIGLISL